jgi:uncharacterized integral membrane protein
MDNNTKRNTRYTITLIIAGLLIYITTQNTQQVTLHFLFWETNLALILVIYTAFILGLIAGIVILQFRTLSQKRREKRQIKQDQKEQKLLEKQEKKNKKDKKNNKLP